MGLRMGMVGVGQQGRRFVPLFKAHPLVDEVVLCDLDAAKLQQVAAEYGIQRTCPSLDALCESDVHAAVIITQNWLHAPQAIQALRAGKHVFSAVPTGITLDEIQTLVQTVEQTGLIYMLGEVNYYSPETVYCRKRHAAGDFGHVVYAEADYHHDFDELYAVFQWRGGDQWREIAGIPPMYYPTHTIGSIVSATGARMTHVSCQGFIDRADDGIFRWEVNRWQNMFSNQTALFRLSNGGSCRINEFRRVGHPSMTRISVYGTAASFEFNCAGAIWVTKDRAQHERLDDVLARRGVATERGTFSNCAQVHEVARLPASFAGQPGGHGGSHLFLVDDFVQACVDGRQPANNVWMAARYAVPGLVAHESALRGGELLEIPDFGGPPAV